MKIGKTGVALATAFAFMLTTSAVPVMAGDYHRGKGGGYHGQYGGHHGGKGYYKGGKGYKKGHGGYHKGHGGYHKGHGRHHRKKNKDWVPFAVIGGIAAVAIIASQANKKKKHHGNGYYSDYDNGGYHKGQGGYQKGHGGYHKGKGKYHKTAGTENCHVVYKTERVRGRYVKKGCTLCYNPDGSAYIVDGSEFVVGYVD